MASRAYLERLDQLTKELEHSTSKREKVLELMTNAPTACFLKNAETGRYIYANPAFILNLGRREDQVIGKTDNEIFPLETAKLLTSHDLQVLKEETHLVTAEVFPSLSNPSVVKMFLVIRFVVKNGEKSIGGIAVELPEGFKFDKFDQKIA